MSAVPDDNISFSELLEALIGPEGKRRLRLRHMGNTELFSNYANELILRLHNTKNLNDTRKILHKFKQYLDSEKPTPEYAKSFLTQFANKKPRTLYRYAQMIKAFMHWYGEPINDFKVKVPKSLPSYTEDNDIDKLFKAIEEKKTHKGTVIRDHLLVESALQTGLRRSELAALTPSDIHADFIIVRHGKGDKDRTVPINASLALRLRNFTANLAPNEKIFKLKPPCITMKIKQFARKAGLNELHTHSLRHKFATALLEKGANIKAVQELLGHENLNTTQVYLSITDKGKREAIKLLEEKSSDDKSKPIYNKDGFDLRYKLI